ncbi:MAG TPA: hypothetical protein VFQ60_02835, partial [Patescibacteria group bacterium]|nr:hypothetical protein [Patescibacteria group bacterium]
PVITPAPIVSAPVISISAPVTVSIYDQNPSLNTSSGVQFNTLLAPEAKLAKKFSLNYSYTNTTAKSQTITVIRELINSKGKIIKTAKASTVLKPNKSFTGLIQETFTKKLTPAGAYRIHVKILQGKNVLDENSLPFTISAS